MREKPLKDWEAFEKQFEKDQTDTETLRKEKSPFFIPEPVYRGQADESWKLLTTLERYVNDHKCADQNYSWEKYYNLLDKIEPTILSLTSNNYKLPNSFPKYSHGVPSTPPGYEFMVYVRHHGFPSPMLDWTASPYVAAFFAFSEPTNSDNVVIYSYKENLTGGKTFVANGPFMGLLGKYANTHPRHHQQQCQYTICYKEVDEVRTYCSHESIGNRRDQDIIVKFLIPSKERKKVMKKLDLMNINAFVLFGSDESMMNMLAYREMER